MSTEVKHDALVVGGGVHGLAAATLLARSGRGVALLEARGVLGGRAALAEFHPGFRAPGLDHAPARLSRRAVEALDLYAHGVTAAPAPALYAAEPDGPGLLLEYAAPTELSASDREAHDAWRAFIARVRPVIAHALEAPAPDPFSSEASDLWQLLRSGLDLRRLGRDDMLELLRVLPMCAADWLDEHFARPLLKAALATPALRAGVNGPWAPHTAGLLLLRACAGEVEVSGGATALAGALERAARAAGCELRTAARVERVLVEAGRVRGVELADGSTLRSDLVVSALDPRRTIGGLVAEADADPRLLEELDGFRARGSTAVLRLALEGPLLFRARPGVRFEHASVTGDFDDLERAFDALKYGALPERPWLDVRVPTVSRPDLAPDEQHVVSIEVHAVPTDPRGGWTEATRARLVELVLARLREVADVPQAGLLGHELWTPRDIEREFGLTGGHLHHGEVAFDQVLFLRPALSCARHRTPIEGLVLAGPGTHPGGLLCLEPALGAVESL